MSFNRISDKMQDCYYNEPELNYRIGKIKNNSPKEISIKRKNLKVKDLYN